MDSIEVSYTLADIYAVTIQSWRRVALKILLPIGVLAAVFVAIPIALDGLTFRESVRSFPWDFYLGLTVLLLLFVFGVCPLIGFFRAKRQGLLGPVQLTLSNEGVRVESRKGQSLVYWSAIPRTIATKSRLFLFIGSVTALVLPRRAFGDQKSFETAMSAAKSYWAASKQ
jgi:hypothetical protein